MKQVLGALRKADEAFGLIREGDRIFIGVSGGKDSLVLVRALSLYRFFAKKDYTLVAGMLGMGLHAVDTTAIEAYCADAGVPFHFQDTSIGPIIFHERKESNPCSLCARMRRAKLNEWAKVQNCNKLALGHHSDDVVETFLLNLVYEGRLGTFSPLTWMDRSDIVQIRPMVFATEKQVRAAATRLHAPVTKSRCPVDGNTRREDMKQALEKWERQHPGLRQNLMHAIATTGTYALWNDIKRHPDDREIDAE